MFQNTTELEKQMLNNVNQHLLLTISWHFNLANRLWPAEISLLIAMWKTDSYVVTVS